MPAIPAILVVPAVKKRTRKKKHKVMAGSREIAGIAGIAGTSPLNQGLSSFSTTDGHIR